MRGARRRGGHWAGRAVSRWVERADDPPWLPVRRRVRRTRGVTGDLRSRGRSGTLAVMRLRLARMAVSVHTPPVGVGQTWDAAASVARVRRWAGVDQDDAPASAWTKYRQAFGWFDAERRPALGAHKLPPHDIERGG